VSPTFLDLAQVITIHRDQIERYGGRSGIRDLGLLEAAVAMPTATFDGDYLHRDLFEMAAAYLFHIVQDHPFVDGNKRTGTVAAVVFLALNGIEFDADEDALVDAVMSVASGRPGKAEVAEFFRTHSPG